MRNRTLLLGVSAAAAALAISSTAGTAALPTLLASVGRGPTTTLKTSGGRPVTRVSEGTYLIVVRDRSRTSGFRLAGTGPTQVRQSTGVRFVGKVKWRVALVSGVYRYGSGAQLKRSFRVASSP
jgi:hypothetical protein